jgi:cytosine/adenosine deaminase-related metal-dependent hydrolase
VTTIVWAGHAFLEVGAPPSAARGVGVEGNRIVDVGALDDLRARYPTADVVGSADFVLLPALVNSHDHGRGLGTLPLGVPDDLLEVWLVGLKALSGLDPYVAAAFDGLRLLRSGVGLTTHSHNPFDQHRLLEESEETLRGYRDAGIRVAYGPPYVDQNPLVYGDESDFLASVAPDLRPIAASMLAPGFGDLDEYLGVCRDLLHRHQDADQCLVQIQPNPVAVQWSSDRAIAESVELARRFGTRVQLHALETRYQRAYAQRRWGKSVVRHLDDVGALGPWLTAAHMVWTDPEDFLLLAEKGVGVAHNPSSNLRLRSGIAPIAEMLRAGVRLGVGLDGHSLDEDQDYLRELRLAWTLANRPGAKSATVLSQDVWRMGTVDGAAVTFGLTAPLGSLVVGNLADLFLIDRGEGLDDWSLGLGARSGVENERNDFADVLLRGASRRHVRHVMVNGRWVVRDGQSTTLDVREIVRALREDLTRRRAGRAAAREAKQIALAVRAFYAGWDADTPWS